MASRLGRAVTPLPQWCTTVAGARPASRAWKSWRGRGLEMALGREVVGEGAVQGARDVAGHRVQRLDLAFETRCGAGVDQGLLGVAQGFLHLVDRQQAAQRGARDEIARPGRGAAPASVAPPWACQAARPPSSTAAAPWPAH
jgi:hypothetical protein